MRLRDNIDTTSDASPRLETDRCGRSRLRKQALALIETKVHAIAAMQRCIARSFLANRLSI